MSVELLQQYLRLDSTSFCFVNKDSFMRCYQKMTNNNNRGYSCDNSSHFKEFERFMEMENLSKNIKKDVLLAMSEQECYDNQMNFLGYTNKACVIFLNCKADERLDSCLFDTEEEYPNIFCKHYYIFDTCSDLQTAVNSSDIPCYYLLCRGIVTLSAVSISIHPCKVSVSKYDVNVTKKTLEKLANELATKVSCNCFISTFSDPLKEFGHIYHKMGLEQLEDCKTALFSTTISEDVEMLSYFINPISPEEFGEVGLLQDILSSDKEDSDNTQETEAEALEEEYEIHGGQY